MKNFALPRLNAFNWSLIAAIILLNVADMLFLGQTDAVATIASIAGVLCVVLSANGHISCYLFGLIEVSLYVLISWKARFYGEVALNGLYFLPMQFIGFLNWRKNIDSDALIKAKSLTKNQKITAFISIVVLTVAGGFVLERIEGNIPYLDASTTMLSIAAMFLMVRAFVEQWWLWIIIDLLTVGKWVVAMTHHEPNSAIMVAMWSVFLINSLYGYWNWKKLATSLSSNE